MGNRYYQGPVSDHFDGKRFYHPGLPSTDKSFSELLRWRLGGKRSKWPKQVMLSAAVRPAPHVEALRLTMIGHASLLVQAAGCNLLVDPVWSERASPLRFAGPRRHNLPAVALGDLPPIHAVLLTHNHYDHMDVTTLRQLWERHRAPVFTPLGNDTILRVAIPGIEVQAGDWWSEFMLPAGLAMTLVPAYHWSSRKLADRRMALWGGFVVRTSTGSLYLAGDTALRDEGRIFRELRERLGAVTTAVLPIGAYAPRWFMRSQHANPDEALQIAEIVGARHLLGMHWGTFPLTDEPWDEPEQELHRAAAALNPGLATCVALRPGSVWDVA